MGLRGQEWPHHSWSRYLLDPRGRLLLYPRSLLDWGEASCNSPTVRQNSKGTHIGIHMVIHFNKDKRIKKKKSPLDFCFSKFPLFPRVLHCLVHHPFKRVQDLPHVPFLHVELLTLAPQQHVLLLRPHGLVQVPVTAALQHTEDTWAALAQDRELLRNQMPHLRPRPASGGRRVGPARAASLQPRPARGSPRAGAQERSALRHRDRFLKADSSHEDVPSGSGNPTPRPRTSDGSGKGSSSGRGGSSALRRGRCRGAGGRRTPFARPSSPPWSAPQERRPRRLNHCGREVSLHL